MPHIKTMKMIVEFFNCFFKINDAEEICKIFVNFSYKTGGGEVRIKWLSTVNLSNKLRHCFLISLKVLSHQIKLI